MTCHTPPPEKAEKEENTLSPWVVAHSFSLPPNKLEKHLSDLSCLDLSLTWAETPYHSTLHYSGEHSSFLIPLGVYHGVIVVMISASITYHQEPIKN